MDFVKLFGNMFATPGALDPNAAGRPNNLAAPQSQGFNKPANDPFSN